MEWSNKIERAEFTVHEIEKLASYAAAGAINEHCQKMENLLNRYRNLIIKLLEKSNMKEYVDINNQVMKTKDLYLEMLLNILLEDKNVKFK